MKKFSGFATGAVVGIVLSVAVVIIAIFSVIASSNPYEHCYIMEPSEESGWISENIKGSSEAPVIIYEYADYQCEYCAMFNPYVDQVIEIANGNLAIVYRNFILDYHINGKAAAAAAQAARMQGYFEDFSAKLFTMQDEWAYTTSEKFNTFIEQYFEEVTAGEGDLAKFNEDRASEAVAKKVKNDTRIGNLAHISGTPAFFYENQLIDFSNKSGGSIKVGTETLSWDHALSGEEFAQVLLDILNLRLHNKTLDEAMSETTE
ncbi:thioredoxin domain-containing protein [Candidatus Saccharibacteria bacterium]|nr:thioredoxin domain-containing protein [Candidatus Saccharibacteria bacterium]